MKKADIGMVGLAVMGSSLAKNLAGKGYEVSVYNYTADLVDAFLKQNSFENISAYYDLLAFVASLEKPRKVFLMIQAGKPVDLMIDQLLPLLEEGDVIIDGGNSNFKDTIARSKRVEADGKLYIGTGVSGGEEGALHGPSLMPGGSARAWDIVKDIFIAIAAKTEEGDPCCDYVGENGAGHFVKMVHNGIEYGDMELICETYQIMKCALGMSNEQMSGIFEEWNEGELDSYLIGITADILKFREEDGSYLIDHILDTAGQKGTGKWTSITALEEGVPLTLISEAVFARCLSAMKEERVKAAGVFAKPVAAACDPGFIEDLRKALYVCKIISYSQGYSLMRQGAKTYGWNLNYGGIALMWRGGCIIRSRFLSRIRDAYEKNHELENLLLDDYFAGIVKEYIPSLRKVVVYCAGNGIACSGFASALTYFDGYASETLPANLLQAQRDYFGAHTYRRNDKEGVYHTKWTDGSGDTTSSSYNV